MSELAFRNERNCAAIVHTEGGLPEIVCLLRSGDAQMQEDATLIINNCAAFCESVCPAIVACPGMLDSLKGLITSGSTGAKYVAVGAINCLSRCAAAREVLLESGVVETALVPVLKNAGEGDKHEAHLARATMAIANLSGLTREMFDDDSRRDFALGTCVKILGHALKGESWAGIHFAPYSVIFPLHNLTCRSNDADKLHLVQSGIAVHLTEVIAQWKAAVHHSDKTMLLAIHMSRSLCVSLESMRTMRDNGILQALHGVTQGRRGETPNMRLAAAGLIDQLLEVLKRARARERERERERERDPEHAPCSCRRYRPAVGGI